MCGEAVEEVHEIRKQGRFEHRRYSEQTIWKLVNEGLISEYADFYHLSDHAYVISSWEGFGKKSVGNMLESIRKSRNTDGRHLLYALNIPLCGGDVAKKLIERYPVKELIETARLCMFDDEFASIDGIGPEKVPNSSPGSKMTTTSLM